MEQNSVPERPEAGDIGALINEKERLTYDQAAKNVLSNKVIVANILSGVVTEFKGKTADEIRLLLKSGVSEAKVACLPTDDARSDMATLSFDINMRIQDKEIPLDIEIDIEPQGKLYPNYKGKKYSIHTRGMIYGCRMLDRQIPKYNNDYSKIHKCYSIWICFQMDGNSHVPITRYRMNRETGEFEVNPGLSESEENKARQYLEKADRNMDLLEVIMIYVPKSYDKAVYDIQKLLYSVFNKEPEGVKPFLTSEEREMIESEVDNMGRLEAELMEMYLDKGREEGRVEGRVEGREEGREEGLVEGLVEGRVEGREEGRVEGREEGRVEGRAEGIEQGEKRLKAAFVDRLVGDKLFTFDKALKYVGITEEVYKQYKPVQPAADRNTGATVL